MNLYDWGRTNLYELATLKNMYELPWDRASKIINIEKQELFSV